MGLYYFHYLTYFEQVYLKLWCVLLVILQSAGVLPDLPTFENLVDLKLMLQGFGVGSTLDCCASLFKRCPILRRFSLNVSC